MIEILSHISWRDGLDIAIVSLILYRLLLIIRGTKAAEMLIGLLVLLVASIVSRMIPLYTLDWLLHGFIGYIVIAMIVIFQPEIRRALAHMGQTSFLQAFASAEELKGLEEIVKAAISLADKKIGALIVIERETTLKDFVELGTQLDAKVSRELLMSIFHPSSPIHDGAVVIRGNRVVAAGCFLPLAIASNISSTMGTRHRAALGITEETDSVVLIVSEETGGISMAIDGVLNTHLDMGTLRDVLRDLFADKKAAK